VYDSENDILKELKMDFNRIVGNILKRVFNSSSKSSFELGYDMTDKQLLEDLNTTLRHLHHDPDKYINKAKVLFEELEKRPDFENFVNEELDSFGYTIGMQLLSNSYTHKSPILQEMLDSVVSSGGNLNLKSSGFGPISAVEKILISGERGPLVYAANHPAVDLNIAYYDYPGSRGYTPLKTVALNRTLNRYPNDALEILAEAGYKKTKDSEDGLIKHLANCQFAYRNGSRPARRFLNEHCEMICKECDIDVYLDSDYPVGEQVKYSKEYTTREDWPKPFHWRTEKEALDMLRKSGRFGF
jgi:hypothetical protein